MEINPQHIIAGATVLSASAVSYTSWLSYRENRTKLLATANTRISMVDDKIINFNCLGLTNISKNTTLSISNPILISKYRNSNIINHLSEYKIISNYNTFAYIDSREGFCLIDPNKNDLAPILIKPGESVLYAIFVDKSLHAFKYLHPYIKNSDKSIQSKINWDIDNYSFDNWQENIFNLTYGKSHLDIVKYQQKYLKDPLRLMDWINENYKLAWAKRYLFKKLGIS